MSQMFDLGGWLPAAQSVADFPTALAEVSANGKEPQGAARLCSHLPRRLTSLESSQERVGIPKTDRSPPSGFAVTPLCYRTHSCCLHRDDLDSAIEWKKGLK